MNFSINYKSNILLIFITILCLFGCVQEFDNFTAFPKIEKITAILDPLSQSQSVDFKSEEGIVFTTDNSTIITIPSAAFELSPGIENGTITFKYLEIYSKGDIIKYDVPTISNGELLASDGVFYFEAFLGNQSLKLKTGAQVKVEMFNDKPETRMELFYGEIDNQDRFNWREADNNRNNTDNVQVVEVRDFTNEVLVGYEFFTDSLKWINVDVFVDIPNENKTEVCIELPEIYNNQNTSVYMVFKDYNSVISLHAPEESSKFCEPYGASPIGANVTFIVISKQGEETYHFALESATITPDYVSEMLPKETSMSDIILALDNL